MKNQLKDLGVFDLNIDFQGNGLDLSLLENIKYRSNKIIARCPACAEEGHDHTGDHLFIDRSGKFGCVVFPGDEGMNHRKIIYKLVGVKKRRFDKKFKVNKLIVETSGQSDQGVQRNILGRLGRFDMTHAYDALILEKSNISLIIPKSE